MKKRYGLLIGLLVLGVVAAGCGKKDEEAVSAPTPTPIIETSGQSGDGNVVSMQQSSGIDKTRISNIMGTQGASSKELVVTNNTGFEIESFYSRPASADDWSEDYIDGRFTLRDKEQALFYYDPEETDEDGSAVTRWDLRVSYSDEDESDCLFRNLTLTDIGELKLNMEDGVPFVTYTSLSTKRDISTLEDAKARMGRSDEEDSDSDDEETGGKGDSGTSDGTSPAPQESSGSSSQDSDSDSDSSAGTDSGDSSIDSGDSDIPENPGGGADRSEAQDYVGQSLDSLTGALGGSDNAEYEENPEDGSQVGYHYYDGFTVATEVDEDGNETVTGIW